MKKRVGCNGRSQRLKICSVGKVVEMNKMIIFFVMYNKTVTHTKYYIIIIEYIIIQFTSPS